MGTYKKSALPRVMSGGQGLENLILTLHGLSLLVKSFLEKLSFSARILFNQLYEVASGEAKGGVL